MTTNRLVVLIAAVLLATLAAVAAEGPTTVVLVRHAEKAAPKGDPPLSEAGAARAEELARTVGALGVDALFATQFRRTRDTLEPLARRSGVDVTVAPVERVEDSARELAATILRDHRGGVVVVAGHSNTVPAIIAALGGEPPDSIADGRYDDLFVLVIDGDRVVTMNLKYGAPAP
jgi:broad specificity phosphatase PhoE